MYCKICIIFCLFAKTCPKYTKMKLIKGFSFVILLLFLGACKKGGDSPTNIETETPKVIELMPSPDFNPDSAYQFVAKQVSFGPRVPNSEGHKACGDYLIERLKSYNWEVLVQSFDAIAYDSTVLKSRNIIASYNPKATKRILLAAHWDTRPFADKDTKDKEKPIDGANDGASGVAVLLEIARVISLADKKPEIGIDIIFFDSEDYGYPEDYEGEKNQDSWCLGSQYWGKNKHKEDYAAYYGVLLDMVGGKNAKFYQEGYSMQSASLVNQYIWDVGNQLNFKEFFINKKAPPIIDDHVYVIQLAQIPMVDIVEFDPENPNTFFGEYHHTHKDNMEVIDTKTLKAVGQTVLQVLYNEKK